MMPVTTVAARTSIANTIMRLDVLCFCEGTRLATPDGEREVQSLRPGELVLTAEGKALPIRWVGVTLVATRFADLMRTLPVRIRAGALGEHRPRRDLLVSPDHAVFLDGILVQAGALVNGRNITREADMPEQFAYYHIELASHELLLADGVATESFVDNASRMRFRNWDECRFSVSQIEELPYPRARTARQLPQPLQAALAKRMAEMTPA